MSKSEIKNRLISEGIEKKQVATYENGQRTSNYWYYMEIRVKTGEKLNDHQTTSPTSTITQGFNSEPPIEISNEKVGLLGTLGTFEKITIEEIMTITKKPEEQLITELDKLKSTGDIYESKPGIYQVLK